MEHSLLHGLQLCGLIFALGGVLFRILVLAPVSRANSANAPLLAPIEFETNKWVRRAAAAAALGTFIDLFVQVAEIQGFTIYAGVSPAMVLRYVTATSVGQLAAIKLLLLLGVAFATGRRTMNHHSALVLVTGAAFASTLISHSAALPDHRLGAITAQFFHIVGAAFWLGMLGFVLLATVKLRSAGADQTRLLSTLVGRFSPYALSSAIVISLSGVYSCARFIMSPRAVFFSAYGLTLLLKICLLGFVAYAGFLNWRSIRPLLRRADRPAVSRFLRLLEFEVSAGVLLMLVAGILGAISPPSQAGFAQLSDAQAAALLHPRNPSAHFADPSGFVGAVTRTDDDLRYAEFTHQWSGIFVTLLGICWLAQSLSARTRKFFARVWPILLVAFGVFISIIADPEVWILHTYSLRQIVGDPQILEHQMGAALVLVLAIFGLRDGKREPAEMRPLGYGLPILIIAGSLMLLGHAHSNLGISEELSSLINMQHAIIGGFGLIAGMTRWLQVRGLPGRATFRYVWPSAIVLLGIFMAFFYRELVPLSSSLALR